jgi:succinoglycan biosynthesis protein ExoM
MHVAVCCITFRREAGLLRLLAGLNGLTFSKNPVPRVTVIVVDNEAGAPVRALVETAAPTFRWSLVYDCEPVQGVSSARNRTLDLVPADADFIAFIDDDEVPEPVWLDELLHVSHTYGASIVQGPLQPVFMAPPPEWVVRGGFFRQGPYRDGAGLHFASTGNSLIAARVVRALGLYFDPRFNLTGGEDQRFFGLAIKSGYQVVTAERALVKEWIPPERARLAYLLRRRLRMGTTLAAIDRLEGGVARLLLRPVKSAGRIGLGLAQLVLLLPRGRAGLAAALCNVAWGAGALVGLLGFTHREYDAKRLAAPGPVSSAPRAADLSAPHRGRHRW